MNSNMKKSNWITSLQISVNTQNYVQTPRFSKSEIHPFEVIPQRESERWCVCVCVCFTPPTQNHQTSKSNSLGISFWAEFRGQNFPETRNNKQTKGRSFHWPLKRPWNGTNDLAGGWNPYVTITWGLKKPSSIQWGFPIMYPSFSWLTNSSSLYLRSPHPYWRLPSRAAAPMGPPSYQ